MGKVIKRVYVAGILSHGHGYYSQNTAINYITGARELTKWGLKLLFGGFDPFVPSFDQWFWWVLPEGATITEPMIKRYSKSWLEVCDAVLLTPGWQQSPGTLKEIEFAQEHGIPVFETFEKLLEAAKDE